MTDQKITTKQTLESEAAERAELGLMPKAEKQTTKRSYLTISVKGFVGQRRGSVEGLMLFAVCPDCGAMCLATLVQQHDEFHDQLEAVGDLGVETNAALNGHLRDEGLPESHG